MGQWSLQEVLEQICSDGEWREFQVVSYLMLAFGVPIGLLKMFACGRSGQFSDGSILQDEEFQAVEEAIEESRPIWSDRLKPDTQIVKRGPPQ